VRSINFKFSSELLGHPLYEQELVAFESAIYHKNSSYIESSM